VKTNKLIIRRVLRGKRKGEFFVTAKAENGEKMFNTETYKRRNGALKFIAWLEATFRAGNFDVEG